MTNSTKIVIIHGSGGSPNDCWIPWLIQKLENENLQVFAPQFPSSNQTQTLENWLSTFEKLSQENQITEDAILIGHSLGVPFILNLLQTKKFKHEYLVAGFVGLLNNKFDPVIKSFSDKKFNWDKIKQNAENISVIYSNNDPYISIKKSMELAKLLKVEPILIENAGHFNSTSNYFQFEFLLDKIKENLKLNFKK